MANLDDILKIESVVWTIKRNDEFSGAADGRFYQAEISDPLWTATVTLAPDYNDQLKRVAARIRALRGSQNSFLMADPLSRYPQYDPDGTILGPSVVKVAAVADPVTIAFKGLPSGYRLTTGDKFSIALGMGTAFHEVSEDVTAGTDGVTPSFGIFPALPSAIAVEAVVRLVNASCNVIIVPGSHKPGDMGPKITTGATFSVIQSKSATSRSPPPHSNLVFERNSVGSYVVDSSGRFVVVAA